MNNTTFYLYGRGKPVAEQVVGWSYYLNDGLNVPRQMSDGGGTVTLEREYTLWGEVLKQAGGHQVSFFFEEIGAWITRLSLFLLGNIPHTPACGG